MSDAPTHRPNYPTYYVVMLERGEWRKVSAHTNRPSAQFACKDLGVTCPGRLYKVVCDKAEPTAESQA